MTNNLGQCLDSDERKQLNIGEFRDSLQFSQKHLELDGRKPKLEIHDIETTASPDSRDQHNDAGNSSSTKDIYSHNWIECMDDFVKIFRFLKPPQRPLQPAISPPRSRKPVVVALLDDGVDLPHKDSSEKFFDGKSFHCYEYGERVRPYYESAAGHGTVMARLIHRICPNATIYVIKLETRASGVDQKKMQIVPESAIEVRYYLPFISRRRCTIVY